MKEKGWAKRIVLYISDEPFDQHEHIRVQMQALCRMIHEVDPAIPIYCSTWKHVPAWDGSLDIWGIGHYGSVPAEKLAGTRAAGKRIWFTTDGQMCTDTPYCAVERLLPHYCFKYGAEAYEFWGVAWHTYDPYPLRLARVHPPIGRAGRVVLGAVSQRRRLPAVSRRSRSGMRARSVRSAWSRPARASRTTSTCTC